MSGAKGERIAKVMARAGLCSRREAERWVLQGRVAVEGKVLTSPAVAVPEQARIVVDGKPIPAAAPTRLFRYHKPRGLLTTHKDPQGRPTVFDRLESDLPRLIAIGRLDFDSEGLLLLTNNGELAQTLMRPATGWLRRYRVRVHGVVEPERLTQLSAGTAIDGIAYGPIRARLDRQKGENAWITVSLREGRNREIRKIFDHLGWPVNRLIRIAYGPFQLGHLPRGAIEEVPRRVLREQLGSLLSESHATSKGERHAHRRRTA
jgi:23S rRNA pseudouridine2605 synthase